MEELDESNESIVLDCGSFQSRVGFSGDDAPRCVFPTIVGKPRHPGVFLSDSGVSVGHNALLHRGILNLNCPIERGKVTNWDEMEQVWTTAFEELRSDPAEHSVMLTQNSNEAKQGREKATEIMFEKKNVPFLYINSQQVLSLYSAGRTTGCVVDSGHGITNVVPIYESYCLPHTCKQMMMGGSEVTTFLAQLLTQQGLSFRTSSEIEVVRQIKETLAYAALDFGIACQTIPDTPLKHFELPDGTVVELGEELFRSVECMFQPHLALPIDQFEAPGLHRVVHDSITECSIDLRRPLYENVVLAGGNTMFPGFDARLSQELSALAPSNTTIKVVAPPAHQYSAWVGGSILASLSSFQSMWISREEYDESGASIVHRKCF